MPNKIVTTISTISVRGNLCDAVRWAAGYDLPVVRAQYLPDRHETSMHLDQRAPQNLSGYCLERVEYWFKHVPDKVPSRPSWEDPPGTLTGFCTAEV